MKRVLLAMAVCSSTLARVGTSFRDNYGVETLGPDISPYRKRAHKGKGQRKANRANRWG